MVTLAVVYSGMILIAAKHHVVLSGMGKEEMLPFLANLFFGPQLGLIASLIIVLACVTTLAALVLVYADYLKSLNFKWVKAKATPITFVMTFALSLIGFDGINRLTAPLLQILYPTLIIIVAFNLLSFIRPKKPIIVE